MATNFLSLSTLIGHLKSIAYFQNAGLSFGQTRKVLFALSLRLKKSTPCRDTDSTAVVNSPSN